MGEREDGGTNGSRGPANRASVSALQSQVNKCIDLTSDDLRSLVVACLDVPGLDLRPLSALTPRQVAGLIDLPEWQTLIKAMTGMAVINPDDRWTKSQWRGLAYFGRAASSPKADKARKGRELEDAIDIEVATQ